MNCCCKSLWTQAVAIVAVGGAIGLADAFLVRPIELHRAEPPPPPFNNPKPGEKSTVPPPPPATVDGAVKQTPKGELPAGQITVDEAKNLYDQLATFVDARKIDPYKLGHVKGAWRIELADFSTGDPPILGAIPRDSVVVVYCSGGHCDESEAVARMLTGSGYKKVYVMHDGIPVWTALGHPVVQGEEPQ